MNFRNWLENIDDKIRDKAEELGYLVDVYVNWRKALIQKDILQADKLSNVLMHYKPKMIDYAKKLAQGRGLV